MEWIVLITLLVAAEYFFLAVLVGKSRSETGVHAPACVGNEKCATGGKSLQGACPFPLR